LVVDRNVSDRLGYEMWGWVLVALFSVNGVTKNWASYITRI